MKLSPFKQRVIEIVYEIPYGKVVSYGQVALIAGLPRGARLIGEALRSFERVEFADCPSLPWWRVVNNAGRISIKGTVNASADLQAKLLTDEGVPVSKDLTLDINHYRFVPHMDFLQRHKLSEENIQRYIANFGL